MKRSKKSPYACLDSRHPFVSAIPSLRSESLAPGGEITDGQPLDRDPWKQWTDLREAVIGRQLCSDVSPLVFLLNKVGPSRLWRLEIYTLTAAVML